MINGLHHTAIATHDVDRLVAFYTEVIGFELVSRGGWPVGSTGIDSMVDLPDSSAKVAMLQAGNSFLEIFQYLTPPGAAGDPDRPVNNCGFTHFGLNVTDIDAEYERMSRAGVRFHNPPIDLRGLKAAYARDPDGNVFEMVEVVRGDHPFRLASAPHAQTFEEAAS